MNKEKPIRDQAERLRKRVERKAENSADKKEVLPPRSEIHRQKQKRTKVKVKYPVIRLMALFFILLPITFFSITSYLEGGKGPLDFTADRAGVELIDVQEEGKSSEENKAEDEDAPAIEEITDKAGVDVSVAPPAPAAGEDKNSPETDQVKQQRSETEGTLKAEQETAKQNSENSVSSTDVKNNSAQEKLIYHTVQPNETLFRVAMKYYKSQEGISIIKNANHIQGNEIQAGQVLKIPIKN